MNLNSIKNIIEKLEKENENSNFKLRKGFEQKIDKDDSNVKQHEDTISLEQNVTKLEIKTKAVRNNMDLPEKTSNDIGKQDQQSIDQKLKSSYEDESKITLPKAEEATLMKESESFVVEDVGNQMAVDTANINSKKSTQSDPGGKVASEQVPVKSPAYSDPLDLNNKLETTSISTRSHSQISSSNHALEILPINSTLDDVKERVTNLYDRKASYGREADEENTKMLRSRYLNSVNAVAEVSEKEKAEIYRSIDRYGFLMKELVQVDEKKMQEAAEIENSRSLKWIKMIKYFEKLSLNEWKRVSKFESRLFKGIPDCLRGKMWGLIFQKLKKIENVPSFESLVAVETPYDHQIDLDIERTMRNHIQYLDRYGNGQKSLFKMLVAYANFNPKVGYCQGMSTVCAFLLLYYEETEGFQHLIKLFERSKIGLLYAQGFPLLFESFYIYERLLQIYCGKLLRHLVKHEIPTSAYATKWFMVFYLDFSMVISLRIWDLFMFYGYDIFVFIAAALVKYIEERIIKLDYEESLKMLNHLEDYIKDDEIDDILSIVKKMWRSTSGKLSKFKELFASGYASKKAKLLV